jgi:hypothetical protein
MSKKLIEDDARKEWEQYYAINYHQIQNEEDFEVAYGFYLWLINK